MKSKRMNNTCIVKLEKGEEILKTLTAFCEQNTIRAGVISGIGGVDTITVKYYDLNQGKYVSKTFEGKNYELLTVQGNISVVDNKPFLHVHVTFGDSDYNVWGGHLESARISITGEIVIEVLDTTLNRAFDSEFQLNLWEM
jgi:predicted DNA-binding protein with PD1-like motif